MDEERNQFTVLDIDKLEEEVNAAADKQEAELRDEAEMALIETVFDYCRDPSEAPLHLPARFVRPRAQAQRCVAGRHRPHSRREPPPLLRGRLAGGRTGARGAIPSPGAGHHPNPPPQGEHLKPPSLWEGLRAGRPGGVVFPLLPREKIAMRGPLITANRHRTHRPSPVGARRDAPAPRRPAPAQLPVHILVIAVPLLELQRFLGRLLVLLSLGRALYLFPSQPTIDRHLLPRAPVLLR